MKLGGSSGYESSHAGRVKVLSHPDPSKSAVRLHPSSVSTISVGHSSGVSAFTNASKSSISKANGASSLTPGNVAQSVVSVGAIMDGIGFNRSSAHAARGAVLLHTRVRVHLVLVYLLLVDGVN